MKFGVIVFPGSNCDDDMVHVLSKVMGHEAVKVWHKDGILPNDLDGVFLPGGFSFGDYLRCGSIAKYSPIMHAVKNYADQGGFVMGICNGFQILCEAGMLPGVLLHNNSQKFICKNIHLLPEKNGNALVSKLPLGKTVRIPIAHAEGRYFVSNDELENLKSNDQILFYYASEDGEVSKAHNPNGSIQNIAGVCNSNRNVFGMMPHPERASEDVLGNTDGRAIFEGLLAEIEKRNLVKEQA